MRKVSDKRALYIRIVAPQRVQEARLAHTQRVMGEEEDSASPRRPRRLPKLSHFPSAQFFTTSNLATEREPDSTLPSIDPKVVEDQVLAVHRSLKSLSHHPPKKYSLLTSDQPLPSETRFLIRNRKWELGMDPYAISAAASKSKAGFLDSVNTIQKYRGTPVAQIRSIQHLSDYHPFNHPQSGELLENMRAGNYLEVQRLVLNDKSLLKVQDSVGSSLLHMMVKRKDEGMMRLLLGLGAEVDATDLAGRTPLYLSCRKQLPDIISLLLSHKADPTKATINGKTPASIVLPTSKVYRLLHPYGKETVGAATALTMRYLRKVKEMAAGR